MICQIICVDGFLSMSHLDIVHMLSAYVDFIHILSGHMRIMRTLFAVILDIFLPNRQCQCHPYVISSTLYISYHVQLSFCTLSAQMHIVHVICMLSAHVHIICLSSLGTPTPKCHGNRSLLVVLFLLKLQVVPHGTKGTGPKFVTRPVCVSS